MAIKGLEADLLIISKLGDNPGADNGLTSAQLKAKFDEAARIIQNYINSYLIHEINKIVDVDYLLSDFLDTTLHLSDKAANAKAVGDAICDLRALFEKALHTGDYILDTDGRFAATVSGDATVRIAGGEGVMQGNPFSLNIGTGVDVELEDGVSGQYRNDLIAVRGSRNEEGILTFSLVGISGTTTSGEAEDPAYTQENLNAGGSVRDFPLYRVRFDGVDIAELAPLFEAQKPLEQHIHDCIEKYAVASHLSAEAVLSAEGWEGESAPYTQTIGIAGILETDKPHVFPVYDADLETRKAQREAWAMVGDGKPDDGTITFTCDDDKPAVAIPVQIEVNR